MRCPKCSFISFDQLATCPKCSRDLSEIVGKLHGTSLKVETPNFLGSAMESPSVVDDIEGATSPDFSPPMDEEVQIDMDQDDLADDTEQEAALFDEDEFDFQVGADETDEFFEEEAGAEQGEAEPRKGESGVDPSEITQEEKTLDDDQVTLNFDDLDLSDLSPESDEATEEKSGNDQESADIWPFNESEENSSQEENSGDIFDDLALAGQDAEEAGLLDLGTDENEGSASVEQPDEEAAEVEDVTPDQEEEQKPEKDG